ncbi:hypothetical protein HPB47_016292 [Ixodes persulcatus]|uniref:Uncharacterized protein n=1 Tax=Ixodes persulcatus TaxID=34615 RepID=A0AC60R2K3_IXOPE|nr:hypothetical protein HPB47_016292 [Ixodes persulcatus]
MADKCKLYKQRFRDCWLKDDKCKQWLMAMSGDPFKAFCKFCKCTIEAKKASIDKHTTSTKHLASTPSRGTQQPTLVDFAPPTLPLPVQQAEGTLALYVAEHGAMNSVDHLGEACTLMFGDSKIASKIKMHRTKCTNVIKNVLGPHFESLLREDVAEQTYSVLIDESTDISVVKVQGNCDPLRQRLPENIQLLQKASVMSVDNALKTVQEPIGQLASTFLSDEGVSACEAQ